jgi:hypothetical protein
MPVDACQSTLSFERALGFEPIVRLTARLSAAFETDFVGATSDVLVMRWFPTIASPVSAAWVGVEWRPVLPFLFGFDDILISLLLVTLSSGQGRIGR